jgi:hypothetical protein
MSFKPYKSYPISPKGKDPVIGRLRTIIASEAVSYKDINQQSDESLSTLYNWFKGPTRRPSHAAIAAVLSGLGYDFEIVPRSSKRSAKVIPLGPRIRRAASR